MNPRHYSINKRAQIAVSLVFSLAALSCSLVPGNSQELRSRSAAKIIRKDSRLAVRSDAAAGVQLLEHIFSKVMNSPQVAINLSTSSQMLLKSKQVKQQQQQASQQGIDYKLAIRPKEAGKAFAAPSPSLQLIAQATHGNEYLPPPPQAAPSQTPTRQTSASSSNAEGFAASDELTGTENWKGSALQRSIALKPDTASAQEKPGVWDREAAGDSFGMTVASKGSNTRNAPQSGMLPPSNMGKFVHQSPDAFGSPAAAPRARAKTVEMPSFEEARRKAPELANSVNKFYKVTKRLDEAQSIPEAKIASADKSTFYGAPREIQIMDDRPVLRDYRSADESRAAASTISTADSNRNSGFANSFGAGAGGASAGNSAAVHGSLMARTHGAKDAPKARAEREQEKSASKKEESKADRDFNYSPSDSKLNPRDNKLALLPPNVATGIPLVSLGTSEAQATHALSSGKLSQQTIGKWSIYSWTKKEGDGSVALQLFFRHGLLDAIRIFDPSLIAPDFGVMPGDTLESVKERFGEPAFMLSEPAGGTSSKNYIYPISQVAFQLARPDIESNQSPQVVSVLIFSVNNRL